MVALRHASVAGVRVAGVRRAPLLAALLVLATIGGLLWSSPTRAEATTCVVDGLNRMCDPGYGVDSFTYDGRPHQFAIAADHSVYHRWAGCGSPCGYGAWTPVPGYSWAGPGHSSWGGRGVTHRIWDSGRALSIKVLNGSTYWCNVYNHPDARGRWKGWSVCLPNGPSF
jgi:hypothetical protein